MRPLRAWLSQALALILAVVVLSGCSIRMIDYTAISSKNVNIQFEKKGRLEAKDCVVTILGIPMGLPHIKEAVDKVLEQGNGEAMVDAVIYQEIWSILLVGQICYKVAGTVANIKR